MNEVLRKEKKFLLGMEERFRLYQRLSYYMIEDSHNGYEGYRVRSLYFDSLNDRDYYEKEDGLELRRKIRLRIYDPLGDSAVLEMKQKEGDNQRKRSLKMKREDAIELCGGRYEVLTKYKEDFAAECYGVMKLYCYLPKTIVEYNRSAFIAKENKIRITFDSKIMATEANMELFDPMLCMYPVLDRYLSVLEVKYNRFLLSYIRDGINACEKSELSVSKYILARNVTKNANIRMY